MAELQTIPARYGVATFVPAGHTIKIVNTSGTQVVDTWAFALPNPEEKENEPQQQQKDNKDAKAQSNTGQKRADQKTIPKKNKKVDMDLPSQEEAEQATKGGIAKVEEEKGDGTQQKSTWTSYVPSIGNWTSGKKTADGNEAPEETEQQKNSRTWGSYFPSGKAFTSYIPKQASESVSAFAASHKRDPTKTYVQQLQDFTRTPVGAAGVAAVAGSGYGSTLYAGYQAWNFQNAANGPQTEFMSMTHTHASTLHLRPQVGDTFVTNMREPILTLIEDESSGIHDTLMAACDPQRYRGLDIDRWEEHGSCAENLVLALKELNEGADLKGIKCIGAGLTVNNVPAPLNLFMNIPWDNDGDLAFKASKSKAGGFVRFKAERDIVVVMSACPQDILEINHRQPTDAGYVVEEESPAQALKRTRPTPQKPMAKKSVPSQSAGVNGAKKTTPAPARKNPVPSTKPPAKPSSKTSSVGTGQKPSPRPAAKPAGGTDSPAERKKPRKLTPRPKANGPAGN